MEKITGKTTKSGKNQEEGVMKKLIVVGAMLLLGLCASGLAYALSANDTVAVSMTVDPSFTFAIGEVSVAMGNVASGGTGGGTATLYCGTNRNIPWTIQVKSSTVVSGANSIPLTGFKFNTYALPDSGGTNSAGTFVGTMTAFTAIDQLAYTAAASEKNDLDVKIGLGLQLFAPLTTVTGTYAATVTATMTE
jgi:hypothetical protein